MANLRCDFRLLGHAGPSNGVWRLTRIFPLARTSRD